MELRAGKLQTAPVLNIQPWVKADVPAELHVFQTGLHGIVKKGGGRPSPFRDCFGRIGRVSFWRKEVVEIGRANV